jgi:hypothetical protein
VAVVAVAVVVGQAVQRSPGGAPVAAAAGGLVSGFGAQQPACVDPVASLGGRRVTLRPVRLAGMVAAAAVPH